MRKAAAPSSPPLPRGPGDRRLCVAQIGAAHGIRGEVRLRAFTENPMDIASFGALESEDGRRTFALESVRPAKGFLVARLAGIDDRSAAEGLRNLRLYVPRTRLPVLEASETYYHADLVGLSVFGTNGAALGSVTAIHDFGAGDLLELKPAGGGPTVLLPFTRAVVPVIDLDEGRLVVDPQGFANPAPERAGRRRKPLGGMKPQSPDPPAAPARRRFAPSTSPVKGEA